MAGLSEVRIEDLYPFLRNLVRIIVILLSAFVAVKLIHKWVPKIRSRIVEAMARRAGGPRIELEKRAATLGGIFRKTAAILIWMLAAVMALREAGFDIGPLLAGAGVVGLAVGFGAQNLVRDVISGLFMLIENQIRVNDVAVINGTSGLVEEINLRTTVLRSLDGTVHVFPNGAITSLSNMTREYSYYVFDIGVSYKEDTDRVVSVMKQVADGLMGEEGFRADILEPLEVLGVDKLGESAIIIKARIKTLPVKQWSVGREMNRRIKMKFEELGIEIPFPHRALSVGEAGKPIHVQVDAPNREALKAMIREVLDERLGPPPAG